MSRQRAAAGVVFLAASGFLFGWVWPAPRLGPRLEMSPEFELGELKHDEEISLAIGFRNAGDEPLRVDPPIPGCKCALATLDRTIFAPGETGRFSFTVRPVGSPSSPFVQSVVVPSNDPRSPRRIVTILGSMEGALRSEPGVLRSGPIIVGEPWDGRMIIGCSDPEAQFVVQSVQCDLPQCEISAPIPISNGDPGSQYAIDLHLTHIRRVGRQVGKVKVGTNHARYCDLTIPLEIEGVSRVKTQPASLLFEGSAESRLQTVVITAPTAIELTAAQGPELNKQFDIAILKDDDGRRWRLELRCKSSPVHDLPQRGAILLSMSGLEHETEVRVPYVVLPVLSSPLAADDLCN